MNPNPQQQQGSMAKNNVKLLDNLNQDPKPKHQPPPRGCFSILDVNSMCTKGYCEKFAQFAIDEDFKCSKRELQLVKVVRGTCQAVNGMIYRLTFLAKELGKPGERTYQAEVLVSFKGRKLLAFRQGSHGKWYGYGKWDGYGNWYGYRR